MPRNRRFIRQAGPFHVGSRTNNREWFPLPIEEVWPIVTDLLGFTARAYAWEIQAFTLMSNHYHLLVRTPELNLADGMGYFKREVTKSLNREARRINHLFGAPYFGSLITDWKYMHAVYKYVYRNPVEAGILETPEAYPYSSLHGLLGKSWLPFAVQDPLGIAEETESLLDWLNCKFEPEQFERIENGLRYSEFKWTTGRSKRNSWTDGLTYARKAPPQNGELHGVADL